MDIHIDKKNKKLFTQLYIVKSPNALYGFITYNLQVASSELQVVSCDLKKINYELRVSFYEFQSNFTSCKFTWRVRNKITS